MSKSLQAKRCIQAKCLQIIEENDEKEREKQGEKRSTRNANDKW